MYMSPRMDVRILCHGLCSAQADTEAYVIDSGILTILGWLVVSPSNIFMIFPVVGVMNEGCQIGRR